MKAREGTFRELMTQDRQFRVLVFQRHYRWRTDQQDDPWKDIIEQYKAVGLEGKDIPRHFIGSVVAVAREADPLHDFRDFRIVDGQQRLTTLSVALAALRDVAAKDDASQFDRLNEALSDAAKWGVAEIEERGRALADMANALWSAPISGVLSSHEGFDWTQVDQAVNALPAGSWTSYGDLADLAGTAAQPTANHVAGDSALKYAHRVLGRDGAVSPHFRWHNKSDGRDAVEVLIGEGLEFDEANRASQAQRLRPAELEALVDQEPAA